MQKLKFGPEAGTPIPGLHRVAGVMIHLPREAADAIPPEERLRRFGHQPFVLDRPNLVVVHHYEPHAEMREHATDEPILCLAIEGAGFLRLGGPEGETAPLQAGEAVLWPAYVPHKVWTEDEPLTTILMHLGRDHTL